MGELCALRMFDPASSLSIESGVNDYMSTRSKSCLRERNKRKNQSRKKKFVRKKKSKYKYAVESIMSGTKKARNDKIKATDPAVDRPTVVP